MRIVGLETEFALGFEPARPEGPVPSQEQLFAELLKSLKTRTPSTEALYYKGGEFLGNGSLIHFEVARLDAPDSGLLEWATPECLGPQEAATYAKAQERELEAALPAAEAELRRHGFSGRMFLLKNNEDRWGNPYGCHESYDVGERPGGLVAWLASWFLHPLLLAVIGAAAALLALPVLAAVTTLLVCLVLTQLLTLVPGLSRGAISVQGRVQRLAEYLIEVGPTPGSGAVARLLLWFLRVSGFAFSCTARLVLFAGHLPALLPFLVTRPVVAGAGALDPEGRFLLTPRARAIRRSVAAFIFGPSRPLVDVKEYFYRRPFSWRAPRKRLHLLAGDANRSEYSELLKLSTTAAVLDAIEAGALDGMARQIRLRGGPVGAFRATAYDPGLRAVVARDRATGAPLTALDVQRRYLEAVWEHHRGLPSVSPEVKDTLVRWNFVLDALAEAPASLDSELDWVMKRRLMRAVLHDAWPDLEEGVAWARLRAWGRANALVEARAAALDLHPETPGPVVRSRLRGHLGWRFARLARLVERDGLDWAEFPRVREVWLRLKTVDLRYHEISREGGYYDWLAKARQVTSVLDPARVAAAAKEPPPRTRAAARGAWVRRVGQGRVRVGWEQVKLEQDGQVKTIALSDPYRAGPLPGEEDRPESEQPEPVAPDTQV